MKSTRSSPGSVLCDASSPLKIMLTFKNWCIQQITVPNNFKKILVRTSDGKDAKSKMSEGVEMICVGLSRTGTSSLKAALSILLPGITYHGMDFLNEINNPDSYTFWLAMSEGRATTKMIRDYFISRQCSAVCDVPSILYWREIHAAFPSAKLVLTERDPGHWFTSINNTLVPLAIMVDRWSWMLKIICFVFYGRTYQISLLRMLLDQFNKKELQDEQSARKFYSDWTREIVSATNNNVLQFEVAAGWAPLCQYLGCPTPQQNFPRLNDSTDLIRHRRYLAVLIFLGFVPPALIILALLFYCC